MGKDQFPSGSTAFTGNGAAINPSPVTESTGTNLAAYGPSLLSWSTVGTVQFTLDAPIPGIEKQLILNTTLLPDSTAIATLVYTGSTAVFIVDGSTVITSKQKVSLQPPFAKVDLIGLSTAEWGLSHPMVGTASLTS